MPRTSNQPVYLTGNQREVAYWKALGIEPIGQANGFAMFELSQVRGGLEEKAGFWAHKSANTFRSNDVREAASVYLKGGKLLTIERPNGSEPVYVFAADEAGVPVLDDEEAIKRNGVGLEVARQALLRGI